MAKTDKKEKQTGKNERQVFDGQVRAQYGDIYKVIAGGVCVEFTDRIGEADSAYKEANKPKEMWKLLRGGGVTLLRKQVM